MGVAMARAVLTTGRPGILTEHGIYTNERRVERYQALFLENEYLKVTVLPELGGQLMHLFESPNRFGLPAFYTLHVWAWKQNRTGAFVNWHSDVSCEQFDGKQ